MTNSRRIAGLLGPTLIAISITEWMNLGIWTAAIGPSLAPLIYLNGTLLFVAGLAIVRTHNDWTRGWPILITITGWGVMLLGLIRMIAPVSAQQPAENTTAVHVLLAVLLVIGVILTFKSFSRKVS